MGPKAGMASCLGTQSRQICALSSLARWADWLCSAGKQSHWLDSWLTCHCKQGCRMGYIAFWMLWLIFLVGLIFNAVFRATN